MSLPGQHEFDPSDSTQFESAAGPMHATVEGVEHGRRRRPSVSEREPEFGERTDHGRGVVRRPGT